MVTMARHVWNEYLADYIAEAWGVPVAAVKRFWRAFPRGRVEQTHPGEFTIYHGNDLQPFMNVNRKRIISAFELGNQNITWCVDPNETCKSEQRDAIRQILGIAEEW